MSDKRSLDNETERVNVRINIITRGRSNYSPEGGSKPQKSEALSLHIISLPRIPLVPSQTTAAPLKVFLFIVVEWCLREGEEEGSERREGVPEQFGRQTARISRNSLWGRAMGKCSSRPKSDQSLTFMVRMK